MKANDYRAVKYVVGAAMFGAVGLALLVLYVFGLLIPLVRFALLLALIAVVGGGLYSAARLILLAIRKSEEPRSADERAFKLVGAVCGSVALLCTVLLCFLPFLEPKPAPVTSGTLATDGSHRVVIPASGQTVAPETNMSTEDKERQDMVNFLGALISAGQNQNSQSSPEYERFQRAAENARVCPRCGGAGKYRYVDGNGNLQMNTCPSCNGLGRSY